MGKRSTYYINLAGGDPDTYGTVFRNIRKESGYTLEDTCESQAVIYDVSWHDMQEDLSAVARKHPDVLIDVDVEGEDREDNWRQRFLGNATETVRMKHSWPPFERILLPNEKKMTRTTVHRTYVATLIEMTDDGQVFASLHADEDPRKVTDSVVSALETERSERSLEIDYDPDDIFLTIVNGTVHSGPEIIKTNQSARFHLAADVKTS